MTEQFSPTPEQKKIIDHEGSAFVMACPGAGKTRVMVERASELLSRGDGRRGIAFLSFTNAAINEFECRLRLLGLLPSPTFPHYLGTFDAFLWQYVVAPFELPNSEEPARLIPDKGFIIVKPFQAAQALPLECFHHKTGNMIEAKVKKYGFNPHANPSRTKQYVTAASTIRARMIARGEIDFAEARDIAVEKLAASPPDSALSRAIAARFTEIIVDEAQDCNPEDLKIIDWLRAAGITIKIICDPHQSIYEFRGGVTDHLFEYAETFDKKDRLAMTGNFRSSEAICLALSALRSKDHREPVDRALGKHKGDSTPVYLLSYPGRSVSPAIGPKFAELLRTLNIDISQAPVLAATRDSGAHAIGLPSAPKSSHLTCRLAMSVTGVHFSSDTHDLKRALNDLHEVILDIGGKLKGKTYHQYLLENQLEDGSWRSGVLSIANQLHYNHDVFPDTASWHLKAKEILETHRDPDGLSIGKKLPSNARLSDLLSVPQGEIPLCRTIHSVKGCQFPAVCVVLTPATAKGIIDYLETGKPDKRAESAREIYVAASRAERLLVIAVPSSQANRLASHLQTSGCKCRIEKI